MSRRVGNYVLVFVGAAVALVAGLALTIALYRREARAGAGARLRMILAGLRCAVLLAVALVKDLRQDFNWLHEKAEGMVVFQGGLWVVNDNDGAGWTRLLNAGKP